jgi:hypothetical protein
LKEPGDLEGISTIEMFVTEQLPNLPNHFPIPKAILSGQPLEISLNLMGNHVNFGIVKHETAVNIFDLFNLSPKAAIKINQVEYDKLKL